LESFGALEFVLENPILIECLIRHL
jgi:hypothetical protein